MIKYVSLSSKINKILNIDNTDFSMKIRGKKTRMDTY